MNSIHQKYIDGSWYEEEYRGKWYRMQYIDTPEPAWAMQCKDYYVGLFMSFAGLHPGMRVLDVGAGVGQCMRAWRRMGFADVSGVEISQTAVAHSGEPQNVCGAAQDIPFADGAFDVVSSFAFLEHADESIVGRIIGEFFRCGRRQVHTVGMDAGTDPSHVNVKRAGEWVNYFLDAAPGDDWLVCAMPDPLMQATPLIMALRQDDIPHPLREQFNKIKSEREMCR